MKTWGSFYVTLIEYKSINCVHVFFSYVSDAIPSQRVRLHWRHDERKKSRNEDKHISLFIRTNRKKKKETERKQPVSVGI